ncbi:phosphoribosylamine--glycine ligase [Roseibium hamelinense]|uniref:Phosphoribosylamine--glycine ligase n=1 Tax=Roseibium hamelinense TaxID=150831 RepID=A0A562T1N9_9HYPH|nr:phosphoribosylamine--glycine ligase [Roseibium hamelinense]MTI42964.1 phosphoribosylamine--glycine ligase [Roseibium hamelinense]TWI87599.1 phosphoribosylamine--glycine ligase [Roseibium hamelinense]
MNILLIGSGGREHALAWAISNSPLMTKLFVTPGNAGIAQIADVVPLDASNHQNVIDFCKKQQVGLVVIGPEAPLVAGLADDLTSAGIKAFGPTKAAAQLEGSKAFTKAVCDEASIPTAAYKRFEEAQSAKDYIRSQGAPIVVKADGLAAGKGVVVATTVQEAFDAVEACFDGSFGEAGASVVVEEFLSGEEASFFVLSDGKNALPLATAQDHKRAYDGDNGPNTGGMGAYSPAPVMSEALVAETLSKIIEPTIQTLEARGTPFKGVLYAGLMITQNGPKLIEYNTRFGDPECQVLMMRLKDDIVTLMLAAVDGTLDNVSARWSDDVALTVVIAAKGYPGNYQKGTVIKGLENAAADPDVEVFHAGTREVSGDILANGGRVLNITARGATVAEAQQRAYAAVKKVDWADGFCRSDIGWRAI